MLALANLISSDKKGGKEESEEKERLKKRRSKYCYSLFLPSKRKSGEGEASLRGRGPVGLIMRMYLTRPEIAAQYRDCSGGSDFQLDKSKGHIYSDLNFLK